MTWLDQIDLVLIALRCGPVILSLALLIFLIYLRKPRIGLLIGLLVPTVVAVAIAFFGEQQLSIVKSECRAGLRSSAQCAAYLGMDTVSLLLVELVFLVIQQGAFLAIGLLSIWLSKRFSHKRNFV